MIYFDEQIETMPLDRLRALQNERLRHLMRYVYERVPFYRQRLDDAGIDPGKIRGLDDLHRLPFTRKSDLRDQYPFGLLAVPPEEVVRTHCSSGTTGKPTVVCYSRQDIDIFSAVVARSLVAAGCRPGWKLQNAYGYGLFTGGLGLHYGAELLGMNVVPVSGGMTERQLMLMLDFQTDALSCTPSYALTLAETIAQRGIRPEQLNLKVAILGAEPWTETIREQVERGLGVRAVNIYGLSEVIGPGVSQEDAEERGTGSYVWEDHFFPEIVDKDSGEPLPEGREGVLVFTTLTKTAMPLLRYWTNDVCSLHYDRAGKRSHVKMSPIRGRADDMLIIRGVNLFHTQVEALLTDLEGLSPHYQLIVSREQTMDAVHTRVEVSETLLQNLGISGFENAAEHAFLEQLEKRLQHKIKENIGINMRVTLHGPGQIPRSEGGKLNRILDKRQVG
jgi:phenylacetate-CoA ligase